MQLLICLLSAAAAIGTVCATRPRTATSDSSRSYSLDSPMDIGSPQGAAAPPGTPDDNDAYLQAWLNNLESDFEFEEEEPAGTDGTPPSEADFQPAGPTVHSTAAADSPGSPASASTTDDFIAGIDSSSSAARAEFFARVKKKLDIRDAVALNPPPRDPAAPVSVNDAETQTYISLRPTLPQRLDRTIAAALHHGHGFEPGAHGAYSDRNPLLHTKDADTTGHLRFGPISTPPWPPYIRHASAETQTPLRWSSHVHPTRLSYLHDFVADGRHYAEDGRTRITIPPPVHPRIPGVFDHHGVAAARAPYATTLMVRAPNWPADPFSSGDSSSSSNGASGGGSPGTHR